MDSSAKNSVRVKALLVGDPGVGKASLNRKIANKPWKMTRDMSYLGVHELHIIDVELLGSSPGHPIPKGSKGDRATITSELETEAEAEATSTPTVVRMEIWSTRRNGREDIELYVKTTYPNASVVGLCYNLANRITLENAVHRVSPSCSS